MEFFAKGTECSAKSQPDVSSRVHTPDTCFSLSLFLSLFVSPSFLSFSSSLHRLAPKTKRIPCSCFFFI